MTGELENHFGDDASLDAAWAAAPATAADSHRHDAHPVVLKLDNGARWQTDEVLHAVIAEIGKGVDAIAGRTGGLEPEQGAAHLVGALDAYASHFDHSGWKALGIRH